VRQVWKLDRSTSERRQVSNEEAGVEQAIVAPDGRILWWSDEVPELFHERNPMTYVGRAKAPCW
jgi:hypothetical protein